MTDSIINNYLYVVENFNTICYNVNNVKSKYRADNEEIKIMAVTKTVLPEIINTAVSCGISLLGENRVQEFLSKRDKYDKSADVHFIGHLQTNKVKYIINDVKMIQSVDSIRLAEEINRLAKANSKTMDILIEINIGGELSKSGINKNELQDLLYKVSKLDNVKVKGLMAIPPVNSPEPLYEKMQKLFVDIRDKKIDNIDMSVLSMGMSNDYQTAIKYGSNLIRIGTGLFGARNYNGG